MGTVCVEEVGVASGYNETQDEEADDVEESDTPEDLLDSLRKSLSGVGGFSGGETDQFSTTEGEGSGNEDAAEALEAIAESFTVTPVGEANVAASVGRNTTHIDDNAQNDEANACQDLDDGKDELNLTVCTHSKQLNCAKCNEEDGDPHTNVDVGCSFPEFDGDGSGGQFERENGEPLNGVLPTNCEAPRLGDETTSIAERIVSKMT